MAIWRRDNTKGERITEVFEESIDNSEGKVTNKEFEVLVWWKGFESRVVFYSNQKYKKQMNIS